MGAGRRRTLPRAPAERAGDHDGAQTAVDAALVDHERVEMPFERRAPCSSPGRPAQGPQAPRRADDAGRACAAFDGLGAPAWGSARAELGRIGGRAPATGELTDAERRIVELVVAGRSNKEIAAQLYLALGTVEAALSKIYRKLGVGSRTELAAFVRRSR